MKSKCSVHYFQNSLHEGNMENKENTPSMWLGCWLMSEPGIFLQHSGIIWYIQMFLNYVRVPFLKLLHNPKFMYERMDPTPTYLTTLVMCAFLQCWCTCSASYFYKFLQVWPCGYIPFNAVLHTRCVYVK